MGKSNLIKIQLLDAHSIPWGAFVILTFGTIAYRLTLSWLFNVSLAILLILYFISKSLHEKVQFNFIKCTFFLSMVACLHYSNFTAYKSFYRFYESIKVGIKESEIDKIRFNYFPSKGAFGQLTKKSYPTINGKIIGFQIDPAIEPRYQDFIHLKIVNGSVADKEWLSD